VGACAKRDKISMGRSAGQDVVAVGLAKVGKSYFRLSHKEIK